MFIGKSGQISRRSLLRRSAQFAACGLGSAYATGLAGLSEAAAQSASGEYKALVCVFLHGGNDHGNTLIPYDSPNYAKYRAIRGVAESENGPGVAIERAQLSSTILSPKSEQNLTDDIVFSLAPTMPGLKARFDGGTLAPLLNVGPLLVPITRAQYETGNLRSYPRPAKLFSHNDQQSTWQTFQQEGMASGWGGRLAELAASSNHNAMFTAISTSGNAILVSGPNSIPYQVSSSGPVRIYGLNSLFGSRSAGDALQSLLRKQSDHILENDWAKINSRAIDYEAFIRDVFSKSSLATRFPGGNSLAAQLSAVARLISARSALGVKRQVFMVSLGGFDTHDGLIGRHEVLLSKLDGALDAFYNATVEMGVASQVTTFTASDFGRTLTSNGNGSDHGWGSHHFILGGDVDGGKFYGTAPHISITSDDQVGQGRLLPSTSVDEYSTTLASWFGVAASDLALVAPNIGRFSNPNIGFMKT